MSRWRKKSNKKKGIFMSLIIIIINYIINNKQNFSIHSFLSPPGWNRVAPSDLAFQVRFVATNELPTSNGSREVDSHQSA